MGRNALVKNEFFDSFEKENYEKWLRKLVHKTMKPFSRNPRWDFDELMSEAWLALCESASKYNPEYCNSLHKFAGPYIVNRLKKFIGQNMYTLNVYYYNIAKDKEKVSAINKIENNLWTDNKSDGTQISPIHSHVSGEMPVDEKAELKESCNIIRDIVNNDLTKREKLVLIKRYRDDKSFTDISKELKFSTKTIKQTFDKGLQKLKTNSKKKGI